MTFSHASVIDPQDTVFVIGAAIFTSLLTEGTPSFYKLYFRHLLSVDLSSP